MRNRKEYPNNWNDEIRPAVLKRDKYKCVDCGVKHRQWIAKKSRKDIIKIDHDEVSDYKISGYKVYKIILHVCHIDNNKGNVDLSNLISKCVTCHAKMDSNYKVLIRKGNKVSNQVSIFDEINGIEMLRKISMELNNTFGSVN